MPNAKADEASAASPPSSTESWPVTDVGGSDDGKLAPSARPPTSDRASSVPPAQTSTVPPPDASKGSALDKDHATEVRGDVPALADSVVGVKPREDTLPREDWSRTRLPVPDEDGAASGPDEPAVAIALAKQEPELDEGLASPEADNAQAQSCTVQTPHPDTSAAVPIEASLACAPSPTRVSSAATEGKVPTNGARNEVPTGASRKEDATECARPGRPAFLVTRPTENGINEESVPSQPSTPVLGTPVGTKTRLPASGGDSQSKEDAGPPTLKIKTLLSDTEQFSASPVAATATSPRTRAFFNTDFSVSLRSPPRVGGAVITEIASDTEFTLVEKISRTTVHHVLDSKEPEAPAARGPDFDRHPLPPQAFVASSRTAPKSDRFDPIPSSPLRHAAASAARRLPFVNGRTIVSTAVPRLMRAESLRQHRQLQEPFAAAAAAEPRLPQPRYERAELAHRHNLPHRHDPPHRREPEPSRARATASNSDSNRAHRSPAPLLGDTPLQALILELQAGLEADPAVYFAVRGVLSAYEEQTGRAPARASSVDEPPSRLAQLRERARAANKAEGTRARSPGTLRRARVSFDDETSGDGMLYAAALLSRQSHQRIHGSAAEHLPNDPLRTSLHADPSRMKNDRQARPPLEGNRPSPGPQLSPWSRARTAKGGPPADVKRAFGAKSRNNDKQEAAIKRRHSFDSTVDYKPGRNADVLKAHGRSPIPPIHRKSHKLYSGPRTSVTQNAEIVFSLADIQPSAPDRGYPTVPRHDHRELAVKPVDGKNSDRRHATLPRPVAYGRTVREQHRDNSITFDFDDFF